MPGAINWDIVIISETHTDDDEAQREAKLIRIYRPEFIFFEGLGEWSSEEIERRVDLCGKASIKEICIRYGLSPEDMGIGEKNFANIIASCTSKLQKSAPTYMTGKVPDTYDMLLKTMFFEMNPALLEMIMDSIGESINIYYSKNQTDMLDKLTKVADRVGFFKRYKTIRNMLERNFDRVCAAVFQSEAQLLPFSVEKRFPGEYAAGKMHVIEKTMGDEMAHFSMKRKTVSPVLAIVDNYHTLEGSPLLSAIEKRGMKYSVIRV